MRSVSSATLIRLVSRPFCREMGRSWTHPELMMRMLIAGYCFSIDSESRLCEGWRRIDAGWS